MEWTLATTVAVGAYLGMRTIGACESAEPRHVSGGDTLGQARAEMVASQIAARGVSDGAVLAAMRKVPRHEFVPSRVAAMAYDDHPLPIGWNQTISQPHIVALMSELAAPKSGARVLEIGTGSGYQTAVLCELGAEVYSIEIIAPLAERAAATLARLGYTRVHTRSGDGCRGWPSPSWPVWLHRSRPHACIACGAYASLALPAA